VHSQHLQARQALPQVRKGAVELVVAEHPACAIEWRKRAAGGDGLEVLPHTSWQVTALQDWYIQRPDAFRTDGGAEHAGDRGLRPSCEAHSNAAEGFRRVDAITPSVRSAMSEAPTVDSPPPPCDGPDGLPKVWLLRRRTCMHATTRAADGQNLRGAYRNFRLVMELQLLGSVPPRSPLKYSGWGAAPPRSLPAGVPSAGVRHLSRDALSHHSNQWHGQGDRLVDVVTMCTLQQQQAGWAKWRASRKPKSCSSTTNH
jgi:hypothetical protein